MDYLVRHLIDNNLCTYNVSVMSILLPQFAVNIWQMWGESIYIYIYIKKLFSKFQFLCPTKTLCLLLYSRQITILLQI